MDIDLDKELDRVARYLDLKQNELVVAQRKRNRPYYSDARLAAIKLLIPSLEAKRDRLRSLIAARDNRD